jgi:hypothetical protein
VEIGSAKKHCTGIRRHPPAEEEIGSPFARSIDLPVFGKVLGWEIQYKDPVGWSSPISLLHSGNFLSNSNVDALAFVPLDMISA